MDHESASIRKYVVALMEISCVSVLTETLCLARYRMMQMVNDRAGQDARGLSKNVLEINPSHSIIVDLNALREVNESLAKKVARQVCFAVLLSMILSSSSPPSVLLCYRSTQVRP